MCQYSILCGESYVAILNIVKGDIYYNIPYCVGRNMWQYLILYVEIYVAIYITRTYGSLWLPTSSSCRGLAGSHSLHMGTL